MIHDIYDWGNSITPNLYVHVKCIMLLLLPAREHMISAGPTNLRSEFEVHDLYALSVLHVALHVALMLNIKKHQ